MKKLLLILVCLAVGLGALGASATTTGNTYYVSLSGNDSNPGTIDQPWRTIQRAVNTVIGGDTVYIRGGTYNERVDISYKGNESGTYITFTAYPGENVILDGTGISIAYGGGLFHVWDTDYIRVSGLHIQNVNGAGIYVAYSNYIDVVDNTTYDTSKSGVGFWGVRNGRIQGNDIAMACHDRPDSGSSEEPITIDSSSYVEVLYNVVHDGPVGQNPARAGGEGINTKENSHYVYVHHNEVYGIGDKTALSIDAWGGDLSHVYYYNNNIHDNFIGLTISNERDISPGVDDVHVFNNLFYNNTRYGVYYPNYMENGPLANTYLVNNTIANNSGYAIYALSSNAVNMVIRNNIISGNSNTIYIGYASGYNVDHNLFYGSGSPYGTDYIVANPLFTNGFHLQSGSPAIDIGSSLEAPGDDYDGIARPQGLGYDLGAFEYASGVFPTLTPTWLPIITSTWTPGIPPTSTLAPTAIPTNTLRPTRTPRRSPTPTRTVAVPTVTYVPPTATYTIVPSATVTRTLVLAPTATSPLPSPTPTLECIWVTFSDGTQILVCK